MKKNKIKKKNETKIKIRGYSKKKATARKATKRITAKHLLL